MVSYDFYQNVYLGSMLSETAFPGAIARAADWLAAVERRCTVRPYGPDSRAMALCAVAETMEAYRKRRQVAQATLGGVSVRYESEGKAQRQLLQNAMVYLDICRGVS